MCASACGNSHVASCPGKCKFDNVRAFRKHFNIIDTVQNAKESRNNVGSTLIQKMGYSDPSSGLGREGQGIVVPVVPTVRPASKAGVGSSLSASSSKPPLSSPQRHVSKTPDPVARPPAKENGSNRSSRRGNDSVVARDTTNRTALDDGSDRHYLLKHVWDSSGLVPEIDTNQRLWGSSSTYKDDSLRAIKKVFLLWERFMDRNEYLDESGSALMLHDGFDRDLHQNMMHLFVHHLIDDHDYKGDSLSSALSHLRSNWKIAKQERFTLDLFTPTEWASLAKEGALTSSELRTKLQDKIARTRMDVSNEMMENARRVNVVPLLNADVVTREQRVDLMKYVGAMLTREAGFRGCAVGVTARDKTKDRALLGQDLAFLVGKGDLLADGSFSEGLHRASAQNLDMYLRGTRRAMEAKLWRIRACVVMNAITKSGQQGMVEIGWRTERELQCVHDLARWVYFGRVRDDEMVFRCLGDKPNSKILFMRTHDLTTFVRFAAATIPAMIQFLRNFSSHSLRKTLATAILDAATKDPTLQQWGMSDEVIRGLEQRATWTEGSLMPSEVYHVRDKSRPYDIMDSNNRGPSAVMAYSDEEKRIRMEDILRKVGHLSKDNEEQNEHQCALMLSLNICEMCGEGEATHLIHSVLCCCGCKKGGHNAIKVFSHQSVSSRDTGISGKRGREREEEKKPEVREADDDLELDSFVNDDESTAKQKKRRKSVIETRFNPTGAPEGWLLDPSETYKSHTLMVRHYNLSVPVKDRMQSGISADDIAPLKDRWEQMVELLRVETMGEAKFPLVKSSEIVTNGQFMIYHLWLWAFLGSLGKQSFTKDARDRLISVENYFTWGESLKQAVEVRCGMVAFPVYFLVRHSKRLLRLAERIVLTRSSTQKAKEVTPVKLARQFAGMDLEGTGFSVVKAVKVNVMRLVRFDVIASTESDDELTRLGLQWDTEQRTAFKSIEELDYKFLEWPIQEESLVGGSLIKWMAHHEGVRMEASWDDYEWDEDCIKTYWARYDRRRRAALTLEMSDLEEGDPRERDIRIFQEDQREEETDTAQAPQPKEQNQKANYDKAQDEIKRLTKLLAEANKRADAAKVPTSEKLKESGRGAARDDEKEEVIEGERGSARDDEEEEEMATLTLGENSGRIGMGEEENREKLEVEDWWWDIDKNRYTPTPRVSTDSEIREERTVTPTTDVSVSSEEQEGGTLEPGEIRDEERSETSRVECVRSNEDITSLGV